MSYVVKNQVNFLRTTREFPKDDPDRLVQELDRSYVDIASNVNSRIIGLFSQNTQQQNGETWVIKGIRYQGLRKLFSFAPTGPIDHGIDFNTVKEFVRCWGTYTDGTNYYGFIFGSNVAIAGQRAFYITPTQIVFVPGAGAPSLTKGSVVLEWISNA